MSTRVDKGEVHPKDFELANLGRTDADWLTFHEKLGIDWLYHCTGA